MHCRQIAPHALGKGCQFRDPTCRGLLQSRLQIVYASLIAQGKEGPNHLAKAGEPWGTADARRDIGLLGSGALGVLWQQEPAHGARSGGE